MTDHIATSPGSSPDASLGELVARMSEQTSRLVRDELRLAQLEMSERAKRAGLGAGVLGGAGLLALFGAACLIAAAVLALAGPMSPWLAAIVVGAALFAAAGLAALVARRDVSQAMPPVPTEAIEGTKEDLRTLKPGGRS